jgi:hypothetical protein
MAQENSATPQAEGGGPIATKPSAPNLYTLLAAGGVGFVLLAALTALILMQMNQAKVLKTTQNLVLELSAELDKSLASVEEMRRAAVDNQQAVFNNSKHVDDLRVMMGDFAKAQSELSLEIKSPARTQPSSQINVSGLERTLKIQSNQLNQLQQALNRMQAQWDVWNQAQLEQKQPADQLVRDAQSQSQPSTYLAYPVETPAMAGERGAGYYP